MQGATSPLKRINRCLLEIGDTKSSWVLPKAFSLKKCEGFTSQDRWSHPLNRKNDVSAQEILEMIWRLDRMYFKYHSLSLVLTHLQERR